MIDLKNLFSQNSPLMKKLIKLLGLLLGKMILKFSKEEQKVILKEYESVLITYSNSTEKDFLRIAVIKSLKFSLPIIFELLKNEFFGLLLSYSFTFVRLLQDEIPEIRQKIGDFLSRLLKNKNGEGFEEYKFNCNLVMERYLELLLDLFINQKEIHQQSENLQLFIQFYLNSLFESEFFRFKKTNYFEKRIFSFDKTNKFHDDFILKRISFNHLKEIQKFILKSKNAIPEDIIKLVQNFAKEKNCSFMVFYIFFLKFIHFKRI